LFSTTAASGLVRENVTLTGDVTEVVFHIDEDLLKFQTVTLGQPKVQEYLILAIHFDNIHLKRQHLLALVSCDHRYLSLPLVCATLPVVEQILYEYFLKLFCARLGIGVDEHTRQALDKLEEW